MATCQHILNRSASFSFSSYYSTTHTMSNPRDDRHGSSGRYRRTSPEINAHGVPFVAGQGGRTVLPRLNAAFPTPSHYQAPSYSGSQYNTYSSRASPGRSEAYSPSYGQPSNWPSSNLLSSQQAYTYSPNEHDPRYSSQPSFSTYSSRHSPGQSNDPHARRLPPLQIPEDDRWQGTALPPSLYPTSSSMHTLPHANNSRPPMASYPTSYDSYPYQSSSSYPPVIVPSDTRHLLPSPPGYEGHSLPHGMNTHADWGMSPMSGEAHSVSPYSRSGPDLTPSSHPHGHPHSHSHSHPHSHSHSYAHSHSQSPNPSTPTDYPVIKKKRKRADATQLKILNEVYDRTAFPTTEERQELAKKLDMSARSVQIWFQNKRQAARQNRTSTSSQPPITHHPHPYASSTVSSASTVTGVPPPGYNRSSRGEVSVTSSAVGGSYMTRSPTELPPRSVGSAVSHSASTYRRGRSPEDTDDRRRRLGDHAY